MKKIFKIVISFFIIVCFFIGVITLKNKEDYSYYLVMGDYISKKQVIDDSEVNSFSFFVGKYLKEERVVNEVNDNYLKNNMTSKKMLEMIEKDSYVENSSLSDLIKKSKYITLTLGINDLINQIKYDSKKNMLVYDKDVISNKIEIFKHNYHEIVEAIKDINKDVKIIHVGCYKIYGDDYISESLNSVISEVSREYNDYHIDNTDIEDKYVFNDNELYLTSLGQEIISKRVINIIKEIEVI